MEGRGRARGRGRGRDDSSGSVQAGPAGRGAPVPREASTSSHSTGASGQRQAPQGRGMQQSDDTAGAPAGRARFSEGRGMATSSEDSTSSAGRGLPRGKPLDPDEPPVTPFRGTRPRATGPILVTRPRVGETKCGSLGTPIRLVSNYFRLNKRPQWEIQQYRVDFEPNILHEKTRRYLVATLKEILGGYLFDGTQLFLIKKLPENPMSKTIVGKDDVPYTLSIRHTGIISMNEIQSLQILNLILRRTTAALNLQLVGRNFYDARSKIDMPELKLEIWPGFITSIRQHEQDILVCAEISHKIMRQETILDIMRKLHANSRDFRKEFVDEVVGTTVLTSYNNKTYRIDDIDFEKNPGTTFDTKNGPVTFVQYYEQRYNLKIVDRNQPLLVSKAKDRDLRGGENDLILLVPELCRATGLTDQMRNDFRAMKAMSAHTRLSPQMRIERLLKYNNRIATVQREQPTLQDWDLTLDSNLVELTGRVLKKESIVLGGPKAVDAGVDWTSQFRNNSMYFTIKLDRWYVVYTKNNENQTKDFVSQIQSVAGKMNFVVAKPIMILLTDDRALTVGRELEKLANTNPQMIFCVVSNNNAERYSTIKKMCCVRYAVPSQVVVQRTITPKQGKGQASLMSVATKVAIQMNCKLGGMPWMIQLPVSGLMTMGYDVCHDPKDKRRSFGAFVATMDLKQSNKFFSSVSAHTNGEELSNQLCIDVKKALEQFKEVHTSLPSRLVMYRDGVGDGQVAYVYEHEVYNLENMLVKAYEAENAPPPKLVYIIVTKRINTRFFTNRENAPPGTVVDDVITQPERYDFYLVSQSVREGTVSPTAFNIIRDTSGLSPDQIQTLTYKFTYLYYNWTGTVRVPAVCQYAHKLAFLVSQSIYVRPSPGLEQKLYFL